MSYHECMNNCNENLVVLDDDVIINCQTDGSYLEPVQVVKAYWWEKLTNFGDMLAPWIISEMTGRPILNTYHKNSYQSLYSVGSVIEHINNNNNDIEPVVWGSGLISELSNPRIIDNLKATCNIDFRAVRGKLTREEIIKKLGYSVPEVFGDPALLMPKFYSPQVNKYHNVVVCPHYIHYEYFTSEAVMETFQVVNLLDRPDKVIDEIVSAEICISTSLHGVIIAQAYGVPWVWLSLVDKPLVGDKFKFFDFFSVMSNPEDYAYFEVHSNHITKDFLQFIVDQSKLMNYDICLDSLLNSFPKEIIMKRNVNLLLATRKSFPVKEIRSLKFGIDPKFDLAAVSSELTYIFSTTGRSTNSDRLVIAFEFDKDLERVEGLHLSPNEEIGFYHYLEVSQYKKTNDIQFTLPSDVRVESVRIIAWNVNENTKKIYFDKIQLKAIK